MKRKTKHSPDVKGVDAIALGCNHQDAMGKSPHHPNVYKVYPEPLELRGNFTQFNSLPFPEDASSSTDCSNATHISCLNTP